ncbi:MAG: hypothetical protein ABFD92_19415 [Planctomycetaceae bacterium]|nr:hypothetical protein [Planctomycetaceae bacterium]
MTDQVPSLPPPIYQQYPAPLPEGRAVWPTVVGIISTILASLGVLGGIGGSLAERFTAGLDRGPSIYDYAADWYGAFLTIIAVASLVLAVGLLIGGISLLKRRPVARVLHLAYAILEIAITAVSAAGQIAALDFAAMPAPLRIGTIIGFASMPLGIAYPVFLIIWFNRRKIKEDVEAMT